MSEQMASGDLRRFLGSNHWLFHAAALIGPAVYGSWLLQPLSLGLCRQSAGSCGEHAGVNLIAALSGCIISSKYILDKTATAGKGLG